MYIVHVPTVCKNLRGKEGGGHLLKRDILPEGIISFRLIEYSSNTPFSFCNVQKEGDIIVSLQYMAFCYRLQHYAFRFRNSTMYMIKQPCICELKNATVLATRFFFFFWLGSAFSKSEEKSILVLGRGTYPVMVRYSTISIPINAHLTSLYINV